MKETGRVDRQLAQNLLGKLRWYQRGSQAHIEVEIVEGVATLTGVLGSSIRKQEVEEIARHCTGIVGVVNRIRVRPTSLLFRTDRELAEAVRCALEWNETFPAAHIRSTVEKGWVRLEGSVATSLQKVEVERVVGYLLGVRGIINRIALDSAPPAPQ